MIYKDILGGLAWKCCFEQSCFLFHFRDNGLADRAPTALHFAKRQDIVRAVEDQINLNAGT